MVKKVVAVREKLIRNPWLLLLLTQTQVSKMSGTFAFTGSTTSICEDLEHLERQLNFFQHLEGGRERERESSWSFITHDQPSRRHCPVTSKSNIPGTHACNSHVFIFYSVVSDFSNCSHILFHQ